MVGGRVIGSGWWVVVGCRWLWVGGWWLVVGGQWVWVVGCGLLVVHGCGGRCDFRWWVVYL